MTHTSASTSPRSRAYAPSVVAHRKPKKKPTAPREVLVRGLTSAEVDAVDEVVDARNVALAGTSRTSRSQVMATWIREGLAREPKGSP